MCSIGSSEGLNVTELGVVAEETRGPASPVLQRLPDGQRANKKTQRDTFSHVREHTACQAYFVLVPLKIL